LERDVEERNRIVILSIVQVIWFFGRFGFIDVTTIAYGIVSLIISFILMVDVVNDAQTNDQNHIIWGFFVFFFGAIAALFYLFKTRKS